MQIGPIDSQQELRVLRESMPLRVFLWSVSLTVGGLLILWWMKGASKRRTQKAHFKAAMKACEDKAPENLKNSTSLKIAQLKDLDQTRIFEPCQADLNKVKVKVQMASEAVE